MIDEILIIHTAISWALLGLIWTIQVVHYPLFEDVGSENFVAYHVRHMWLVSWVVGPLMLAEVGSAGLLLYLGERSLFFWVSLAALMMIWISTLVLQIPLHGKLVFGYDADTIRKLVQGNWWRTLGWTIRGVCLVALLFIRI
jgi:hypothetical protein